MKRLSDIAMRLTGIVSLFALMALCLPAAAGAQGVTTGVMSGVVTNAQGRYVVPNLKPSTYTITIKFGSFQPLEYTDMPLAATLTAGLLAWYAWLGTGRRRWRRTAVFRRNDPGPGEARCEPCREWPARTCR